eukprot:1604853-Amphidinium_carterae.1
MGRYFRLPRHVTQLQRYLLSNQARSFTRHRKFDNQVEYSGLRRPGSLSGKMVVLHVSALPRCCHWVLLSPVLPLGLPCSPSGVALNA